MRLLFLYSNQRPSDRPGLSCCPGSALRPCYLVLLFGSIYEEGPGDERHNRNG